MEDVDRAPSCGLLDWIRRKVIERRVATAEAKGAPPKNCIKRAATPRIDQWPVAGRGGVSPSGKRKSSAIRIGARNLKCRPAIAHCRTNWGAPAVILNFERKK